MNVITDSHVEGTDEHEDHGLSDVGYIKIALLLAVLTAIEVLTYFVDFGVLEVPSLLILMVVKFQIVISYFMHLKFDNKIFSYLFITGLVLAMVVFAAMATSLVFWTDPAGCDAGQFC
ncbi:MAG: cytochrome C oxidase subunit IV family protein [Actinomycetota bacterium]|nr:cytochrome C oxidase subunit IV family protein [Actinomycetota bacterium]MDG2120492.1 cytochrome C oxidase subunit IV family protein [Actinomycetota bacterium]